MKKVLYLVLLTAISLTSCKDSKKTTEISKKNLYSLIDTKQDSIVRILEKLPEYKGVIFLSQKESKEYLDILIKNQEKFKSTIYKDLVEEKTGNKITQTLKISIDTVQSTRPLAKFSQFEEYSDDANNCILTSEVYYLSKLRLVYLRSSVNSISTKDYEVFDYEIRRNFVGMESSN